MYKEAMEAMLKLIAMMFRGEGWTTTLKTVKTAGPDIGSIVDTLQVIFKKDNVSFDIINLYDPHGYGDEWSLEAYLHTFDDDKDVINYYYDEDIADFIDILKDYIKE